MSVLDLIRPDLKNMIAYQPEGEGSQYRLHTNELPWSPLAGFDIAINQYPDSMPRNLLTTQLASHYQVASQQLIITRGSDEGIDLLMRLFLRPNQDAILQFSPTFSMYEFYAKMQQAQVINCPLDQLNNFNFPSLQKLTKYWQPQCKLIIVCRPNNPTANLPDLAFISALCRQYYSQSLVVVDEAYIEFTQAESAACLLKEYDNLIILRTLSKAYGMAGMRLGCVIGNELVIKALSTIIVPFSLSTVILSLAQSALANPAWFNDKVNNIINQRQALMAELNQLTAIDYIYPSCTNFILVRLNQAKQCHAWLAQQGIAVRHFAHPLLANHLRITVGSAEQNRYLLNKLVEFQDAKNLIY